MRRSGARQSSDSIQIAEQRRKSLSLSRTGSGQLSLSLRLTKMPRDSGKAARPIFLVCFHAVLQKCILGK
jgi:hypothetical protein